MTCIAAIASNGKVHMASDSAATSVELGSTHVRKDSKMFVIDEYLIGFSNSFRFGQIVKHDFVPPKPDFNNLERTMSIEFVAALQETLERNKFNVDQEKGNGGDLIIGVGGRLFVMEEDFQVGEYQDDFIAIGSGYQFALGSLHSTRGNKSPRVRLTKALHAASQYAVGVSPPFLYHVI